MPRDGQSETWRYLGHRREKGNIPRGCGIVPRASPDTRVPAVLTLSDAVGLERTRTWRYQVGQAAVPLHLPSPDSRHLGSMKEGPCP
jgi:hypothetical protein